MLNDLLDLSKIEAGRMDVNPEQFDVKALAYGRPQGRPQPDEGIYFKREWIRWYDWGRAPEPLTKIRRFGLRRDLLCGAITHHTAVGPGLARRSGQIFGLACLQALSRPVQNDK